MCVTAANISDRPTAFRYPRGESVGYKYDKNVKALDIGKGRLILKGNTIAILSFGARLQECIKASELLEKRGLSSTVADARFCKPLDKVLVENLYTKHSLLVSVEEGVIGGFGSHVSKYISDNKELGDLSRFLSIVLPDRFIEQGSPDIMYKNAGLDAESIADHVQRIFNVKYQNNRNLKA